MKHHHACQFLSFRVPSIPSRVEGQPSKANNSHNRGFLGSLLGTSASYDDVSSQLSNPSDAMIHPINSDKFHLTSSFSTASPSPSPSRRYRHAHGGQAASYPSQFNRNTMLPMSGSSKWKPSGPLEVVGETYAQDTAALEQDETNVSTILEDLATTLKEPDVTPACYEMITTQNCDIHDHREKPKRCSLWSYLKPFNCVRHREVASGKCVDDGHSSSRGGDASRSSGSKNNRSRGSNRSRQSINNEMNGRETPTSRGSDDMSWHNPRGWRPTAAEDGSVVSDSAPLLRSFLNTSSVGGGATHALRPQPEQTKPLRQTPHFVRPARSGRFTI
jgi:hypothetical protein